ncbi:hypothetical protein LOAG_02351 [Loa loa]|uniref:Uncharacterized protein n=1 Tax=Loa loa TaxID=7209 RepID=A0A1S0U6N5_LOALO|nr:hypothetical protein LOAG_02351 [Loa loa]EFO26134.1 hypothetical protein LOAG_02351 [Loa loa]
MLTVSESNITEILLAESDGTYPAFYLLNNFIVRSKLFHWDMVQVFEGSVSEMISKRAICSHVKGTDSVNIVGLHHCSFFLKEMLVPWHHKSRSRASRSRSSRNVFGP